MGDTRYICILKRIIMKVLAFLGFTVQLSIAYDLELVSHGEINFFNDSFYENGEGSGDDRPTTQPPTTQRSSTEPSEDPTTTTAPTTTAPTSEPLKCETCSVDKIGPYAIKAGEGGCKKTSGNPNYAYYHSVHYRCQCLIQSGNDYTFDAENKYESCQFMHYNVPATDAPQTWAVATWFILLVVTGFYFLMFAQNIKPTTIPPYNRGVLALVVLLGITMIVTFCGMSANLTAKRAMPTAMSAVSFTLFSLAVSGYLVYGLVTESRPNLDMNMP